VHAATEVEVGSCEAREIDVGEHAELEDRNSHGFPRAHEVHVAAAGEANENRPNLE
jgi:hypothetical protein